MQEITGITAEYKQKLSITITNFGYADLTLSYKPNQFAWFFDLTWQEFTTTNQQLTMSPNILRQYRNILPFGIICSNNNNLDPLVLESFVTDTKLYLIDSSEIISLEAALYG